MPEEKTTVDVTILGAGLTGLTTAYLLSQKRKSVRVIEKSDRTGGVINTLQEKGFTFETGPNTGSATNAEITKLFDSLGDSCEAELANQDAKYRWIWKGGKWNALPSGPISAISTPLFTLSDKFRILGEPFRKAGDNPNESVADMVVRRLGKSFLTYAVDPFISGVYAGDPTYLITRFALPRLYNLEHNYGSFVGGAIKKKKESKGIPDEQKIKGVFSVKGGLKNLITALEKSVKKENIYTSADSTSIRPDGELFTVRTVSGNQELNWKSKYVILTGGSSQIGSLLPFLPAESYSAITALEYAKVVQAAVGFSDWQGIPIKAFGGLIPSAENRNALGILFPSSIFSNKAPNGGATLSVFLGGFRHPEMVEFSDQKTEEIVLKEISETLGVSGPKPDLISIHRYQAAIPQYGLSSEERYKQIEAIQKQYPGLLLAGNIRDGIGMADRIKQAYNISELITE